MSLFGDYFKHLRKNVTKKTLRQFCRDCDLDAVRISKIERGVIIPKNEEVVELSMAIGENLDEKQFDTMMELSTLNDKRTYSDLTRDEKKKQRMDIYMGAMLCGGAAATWEEAEDIARRMWTE